MKECNSSMLQEIIIGTNEEFLIGYSISPCEDKVTLQPSFTNHSHTGRIKEVATNGRFLVSGSTDEFIKIFDLQQRKEVGSLTNHTGTITCLQFHESGFLFSGSDDGNIGIFKASRWSLEREMKAHKMGITGLAIHPSGKIGLSIARDKRLITWDLMKGRKAFVSNLKNAGECISWCPQGKLYLIASLNTIDVYSVETANIEQSIDFRENVYCFCFITDELIAIGGERKELCLYNLALQKEVAVWKAHENRTKCLASLESYSKTSKCFASASSDGFIRIWNVSLTQAEAAPTLLGEVNTKCRIICMAVRSESQPAVEEENVLSKKFKKVNEERQAGNSKKKWRTAIGKVDSENSSLYKEKSIDKKGLQIKKRKKNNKVKRNITETSFDNLDSNIVSKKGKLSFSEKKRSGSKQKNNNKGKKKSPKTSFNNLDSKIGSKKGKSSFIGKKRSCST